ncbi:hypothetical protein GCM10009624_01260 [Gordonia sinesedis]
MTEPVFADGGRTTARDAVLFVSHTPAMSGAEAVMLDVVDEALRRGKQVTVAIPPGAVSERLPATVAHVRLPPLGLDGGTGLGRALAIVRLGVRWLQAARRLRPYVRDTDTAVIINSLFALPAVRLSGVRRRGSWLVHDTLTRRKQKLMLALGRGAVGRAVAVSRVTAESLGGPAAMDVVVAYNGVRVPTSTPERQPAARPVVGVLAKIVPWKGHRLLLDALRDMPDVDIEFAGDWFPGDGAYVDELKRLADEPPLRGRVTFLGKRDPAECLQRWTAMVSPSIEPEAGPLGVLEAMSLACPVIGTAHGGTAEYLADGAGLLVEPGNPEAMAAAVARLIADDALQRDVATRARARVAAEHDIRHTLPRMASHLFGDTTR